MFGRIKSIGPSGFLAFVAFVGGALALGGAPGCSDSGTGGSGGSACEEIGADGCFDYACYEPSKDTVTFSGDVLPVFEQSCALSASCHGNPLSPSGPAGYQPYLGEVNPETTPSDVDLIFMVNVGADSVRAPSMKIIDPGKPETSFLMHKMDGDLDCAELACLMDDCLVSMPQGSGILPRESRDKVRNWILQGAEQN